MYRLIYLPSESPVRPQVFWPQPRSLRGYSTAKARTLRMVSIQGLDFYFTYFQLSNKICHQGDNHVPRDIQQWSLTHLGTCGPKQTSLRLHCCLKDCWTLRAGYMTSSFDFAGGSLAFLTQSGNIWIVLASTVRLIFLYTHIQTHTTLPAPKKRPWMESLDNLQALMVSHLSPSLPTIWDVYSRLNLVNRGPRGTAEYFFFLVFSHPILPQWILFLIPI